MPSHHESMIQQAVCQFLRVHNIPFLSIPNEGKRNIVTAMAMKRMGMRSGVSDLFLPRGNNEFKGLWLEIKTEKGKVTDLQKQFILDMKIEGYEGIVGKGLDECLDVIKGFYHLA